MYMRLERQALTIFDTKKVFQKRLVCCFHQKKTKAGAFPETITAMECLTLHFNLFPFIQDRQYSPIAFPGLEQFPAWS